MTSFLVLTTLLSATFSGIYAARVKQLKIPHVVRNGTGPFELSCIYEVNSTEMGLVVKWFHNEHDLIYQWIPPIPPQDVGLIKGFAEYPEEVTDKPMSHSVIRLKQITLDMDGEYTCSVSTYQEESTKTGKMIVYAPETNATIEMETYNQTHVNFTCVAFGARPRPNLAIHVEGVEVEGHSDFTEDYAKNPRIRRQSVVQEPSSPVLVECEIVIPETEYRRRKGVVYYPRSHRSTTSVTSFSSSSSARTFSTPLSSSVPSSTFSTVSSTPITSARPSSTEKPFAPTTVDPYVPKSTQRTTRAPRPTETQSQSTQTLETRCTESIKSTEYHRLTSNAPDQ